MLNIDVYSTRAVIRSQEPLTVGLVGAAVQFRFSDQWKSLVKTVVFRQGTVTRDILGASNQVVIPWEVLQEPGLPVYIGIYGSDSSGKVVIPTVWAVTDPVVEGADPAADVTLPPTPEVTQQLQNQIGSLDQLNTAEKSNLVGAINEAGRSFYTVSTNTDGTVNRTVEDLAAAYQKGKCLVLYDGGYLATVEVISKDSDGKFVFTFCCHDSDGHQRVYKVCHKDGKSVFELSVTKLRAVLRVSLEQKDGVYQANQTIAAMKAAYLDGKDLVCYLGGRELCLMGTDKDSNNRHRFHFHGTSVDGNLIQRVTISAPAGDVESPAVGTVRSNLSQVDLSAYSLLGKVGIIGDSLSVGVEDNSASESTENTDHSWGAYLSRAAGNPCAFLGFSGATSSTWVRDHLDAALLEANRCDAYIIGLGFNDCRGEVGKPNVFCGYMSHISGSDTFTDVNHNATPYGSYYFNMEKIIRNLHTCHPDAPIFVLTNPEFTDYQGSAADYNQALRNICTQYGGAYNAHLIDLKTDYGPIFENLESVRGPRNHFERETYAYIGQVIGTAITRHIQEHPDAYPRLKGFVPVKTASSLASRYTVATNGDGTVNHTVDELTAAYKAGQCLMLYDNGYLAALEVISKDSDGNFVFTFHCHDSSGKQKVYKVSSPNLVAVTEHQSIVGGNVYYYEREITLEEAVQSVNLEFPVDFKRFIRLDIRMVFGKVETEFQLYSNSNGSYKGMPAKIPVGDDSAAHISMTKINLSSSFDEGMWFSFTAAAVSFNARPSNPGNVIGLKGNSTNLYTPTENAAFPAGTKITIWGVYEQ